MRRKWCAIGGFCWRAISRRTRGGDVGVETSTGRTALYDALIAGLDHLNDASRPRKALVVISDGGDNASRATLDAVLARAHKSNAAIYTIGVYDPDEADKNRGALKALARATGGERFEPASPGELLQVCKRIARETAKRLHHRLRAAGSRRSVSSRARGDRARGARARRAHARPATLPRDRLTPSSQP